MSCRFCNLSFSHCFTPMVSAMGKPHRLPAAAWLILGVLVGLHLPLLKSLFGNQLLRCTGICSQQQRDTSSVEAGTAAAFSSFVYPTWPVNERVPTVRTRSDGHGRAGCGFCQPPLAAAKAVAAAGLSNLPPAASRAGSVPLNLALEKSPEDSCKDAKRKAEVCSPATQALACCAQESWAPPPPQSKRKVDDAWLWGYVPALDPRGLQRGLLHHGDPARLRRAVAKLLDGEPTVVAAVGGSISVGRGSATQVRGMGPA